MSCLFCDSFTIDLLTIYFIDILRLKVSHSNFGKSGLWQFLVLLIGTYVSISLLAMALVSRQVLEVVAGCKGVSDIEQLSRTIYHNTCR